MDAPPDAPPEKPRRQRTPRPKDQLARLNALKAARKFLQGGYSRDQIKQEFHCEEHMLHAALFMIRYATAEELAEVETGERGLESAMRVVSKRTRNERTARMKPPPRPKRAPDDIDADIFGRLRDALVAINGLPRPADVVLIVRKNNSRVVTIDRQLLGTLDWITEFSNAWTQRQ